jgi:chloramphenicol-sensitive protein RarD
MVLGAYVIWGLFPLYWKQLVHVDALEILAHRILWSVPFAGLVIVLLRRGRQLLDMLRHPRRLGVLALTACLISVNWGVYIWAMGQDKILEASMGYFLTPLLNVLIGGVVFREKLHRVQWLAVMIAALGVLYLFVAQGVLPWIALALGGSFAAYGALRKQAAHDSINGFFMETVIIAPVAVVYIALIAAPRAGGFMDVSPATDLLLMGAGALTATPLLLFVAGAKRLHYATVGLLFYLTPTIQFLVGVLVYDEPLTGPDLLAFACIWTALALFAGHGYVDSRANRPQ